MLVLDEINKVPHWAETVKTLWDRDRMEDRPLRVVLLGSAPICWHVQAEQGPEFTTGEKETEKWTLFLSRVARRTAIEVKSVQKKVSLPGMAAFSRAHGECEKVLIGGQGMSLEQFLLSDPTSFN